MAYQSIQGTTSGRLDLLNKIKDFLVTTVGRTPHDDQSADARPYYVFKSAGESGSEDIYLRFQIGQSSGRIEVAAFQYWDNTIQTGIYEAFHISYNYLRAGGYRRFHLLAVCRPRPCIRRQQDCLDLLRPLQRFHQTVLVLDGCHHQDRNCQR